MKVAHFSDLHYSPGNLVEADRCFSFAVANAVASGADIAVISGDSTDHRLDAHSPALNALATRVHELSNAMPVIMLQGTFSHEPAGTLDNFAFMYGAHPIVIADEVQQIAFIDGQPHRSAGAVFSERELEALLPRRPTLVVTALPTISKGELAVRVGALNAATALADVLGGFLGAAGQVNDRLRLAGIATIGISHGTVNGCQTEHGVTMAGFDHEFSTTALFDAQCSAFLLGHIHKEQGWEYCGRMIGYPGSIGRFHYGEEGAKGYLLWDVDAAGAQYGMVTTPARETVCLDFNGPPDMARLAEVAAMSNDKFVRVRWQIDEEHRQSVDREAIAAMFANAAELKVEARILPVSRSRAQGISLEATLEGKLARWAGLTNIDATPLLGRVNLLEASDAQGIVDEVLLHLFREDEPDPAPATALGLQPAIDPIPLDDREASITGWFEEDLFAT